MMKTMEDIQGAADRAGNPWFGPAEMSGFGTRLSERVYPLRDLDSLLYPAGTTLISLESTVFVSSERDRHRAHNPRLYTVWLALAGTKRREPDGREVPSFDVMKVSKFGEYRSLNGAHGLAKRWAHAHPRALEPKPEEA
jgi:hypothetical protein